MAKKSKFGSMKRYGPRYGRRNKERVAALEQEYRFKHVCPYCNYEKLKRMAAGIWQCEKCKVKFAGKAFATPKKKKVKEEQKVDDLDLEEEVEETEEPEDNEDEDTESADKPEGSEEPAEESTEDAEVNEEPAVEAEDSELVAEPETDESEKEATA